MTTHTCPGENWSGQLTVLLGKLEEGDVIRVPSEFASELVRQSLARMRPALRVEVVVQRVNMEAGRELDAMDNPENPDIARLWFEVTNMQGYDLHWEWMEADADGEYLKRSDVLALVERLLPKAPALAGESKHGP